ncbi:hypothetical protein [Streptomyces sp. NPDC000618]|uniref:hypothetical protein n=1 Tax=Streptomyces sp. NPDC000618 TaxID=3154265 RepID=UPI003319C42C
MTTCTLCEDETGEAYLCERDTHALAGRLARLPDLVAELGHHLVPRVSGLAEHIASGPAGPRSPLNEDVLDLMMSGHFAAVVRLWRIDVQRERWPQHSPPPPAGVAADCRWLGMELEWIAARYPAAGELAREVRSMEGTILSIVGAPPPRPQRIGLCVAVTDDQGTVCGAVLTRLPGQPVRCRWCRTEYRTETDLLLLRHHQPKATA